MCTHELIAIKRRLIKVAVDEEANEEEAKVVATYLAHIAVVAAAISL